VPETTPASQLLFTFITFTTFITHRLVDFNRNHVALAYVLIQTSRDDDADKLQTNNNCAVKQSWHYDKYNYPHERSYR